MNVRWTNALRALLSLILLVGLTRVVQAQDEVEPGYVATNGVHQPDVETDVVAAGQRALQEAEMSASVDAGVEADDALPDGLPGYEVESTAGPPSVVQEVDEREGEFQEPEAPEMPFNLFLPIIIAEAQSNVSASAISEAEAASAIGTATLKVYGDFDNDGYDDLVIGVPREDWGSEVDAGMIHVIYGTSSGLSTIGNQYFTQDNLAGTNTEPGDEFGSALAVGDFDNDSYDDLAVGAPGEDWGTLQNVGVVHIIYGAPSGLSSIGNQLWTQNESVGTSREANDRFGASLVVGNFDGDSYDDLAVGSPAEDWGSDTNAGVVQVLFGAGFGLTSTGSQIWHQDITCTSGTFGSDKEPFDNFGWSLAAGDFDDNGRDDLAVGVPFEDVGTIIDAGWVNVISYRSRTNTNCEFWSQNPLRDTSAETGDYFGYSLATGNFDGFDGGYDDLAVGAPREDWSSLSDVGVVHVIYSGNTSSGLSATNNQLWTQNALVGTNRESDDFFGYSLAAGDFGGTDHDDLAIGSPEEDWGSFIDSGVIHVLYGSSSRLSSTGNQLFRQTGLSDTNDESDDRFGAFMSVGDYDGDFYDDLTITSPDEDWGSDTDAGVAHTIYGTAGGLTTLGNRFWYQDNLNGSSVEPFDYFGGVSD